MDERTSFLVDSNGQLDKARDYRSLIITYINGTAIHLSDVATVIDSVEDKYNIGYYNQTPSVMIGVTRQTGANMLETIDAINAALQTELPGDVELHKVVDRSPTIRASLYDTEETLLIAIFLVIAVVFIFLRNLQAVIIPALALPVSLIGTCAVMYLLDYSLDNLSLMALIICTGFVVDDAIVVLENITRYIEEGLGPVRASIKGAQEVGFTVLAMTLSLVAVFIPILLMGSIVGRLFREFAVTLTVSLLISMVVSLSLTPMLFSRLLRRKPPVSKRPNRIYLLIERGLARLLAGYALALGWVMRHQRLTLFSLVLTIMLNFFIRRSAKRVLPQPGYRPADGDGARRSKYFVPGDETQSGSDSQAYPTGSSGGWRDVVHRRRRVRIAQQRYLLCAPEGL